MKKLMMTAIAAAATLMMSTAFGQDAAADLATESSAPTESASGATGR
jgi:hypothetical protein